MKLSVVRRESKYCRDREKISAMSLSDTIKVKYKLNTCGLQTHEVAKLLRDKGVKGFTISSNDRSIIVAVPREDIKRNRKIMEDLRI